MSSQAYKETGKRRLTGNGEEDTALVPAGACVAPEELWERLPRGQGECVQAMELVRVGCQIAVLLFSGTVLFPVR